MVFHSTDAVVRSNRHPNGITDTRPSFTSPIDARNLSPQYLPYSNGIPTHPESDDMDCSPLSPMLLSDVDMDILTNTPPAPPWTRWNTIPEYYIPVPPFHHNTFVAPDSIWETPAQEPTPPTTRYRSGFAALNAPSFHALAHTHWDAASNDSFASAAPEPPVYFSNPNLSPPTYDPCPLYAMNDRIQDAVKMQPPHRVATPHPSSIATLLDEFERSLTLVADESPYFEAESDHHHHFNTPDRVIEGDLRVHPPRTNDSGAPLAMLDLARSNDHPDGPHPFEREATEPLGEDQTPAYFLDLHEPFERESTAQLPGDPPPFEREPNVPFKKDENHPPADLADQPRPRPPLDPAPFPTYTIPGPPATLRAPRAAHPLARPRPPTPPPSRRLSKPAPRHNIRITHLATHCLVTTSKTDLAELPAAQTSVQAGKSAQLQPRLGAARVPRPPPRRAQVLDEEGVGRGGGGSGWGAPPGRRTALGAALHAPAPVRCSRQRREEEGKERRVRTKRTRFVVPAAEDEGEEDIKATPGARPGWTGPDSTRRTSGPGPLRSILRNKQAVPYDKAIVRHGVRRASVP